MSKQRVAIALAVLCIAAVARSQSSYLVKNLNQTNAPYGSYPDGFVTLGSLSIFATHSVLRDPLEVWRSDGSEAGTYALGAAGGRPAVWNGKVWFQGRSGGLYSSDGSQAAVRVPLPGALSPSQLIPSGPWLYFIASDQLWRTDGTGAGTSFVPTSPSTFLYDYNNGAVMAGQSALFLTKPSSESADRTLWRADAQLQQVLAFPFSAGYFPLRLISAGPIAFLLVHNLTTTPAQIDLWRTDGTAAGTFVLKSSVLETATTYSAPYLYFNAGGTIWRTDGSAAGTAALPVNLPQQPSYAASPLGVLANGSLIITGPAVAPPAGNDFEGIWSFDGTNTTFLFNLPHYHLGPAGRTLGNVFIVGGKGELWRTDGTAGGSYELADVTGDYGNFTWPMGVAGSTLFFGASDPSYGYELRKTDGTVQNTVMVKDIVETTYPSLPATLRALNGGVVFTAHGDGDTQSGGVPRQLWFSDGTAAGTTKLLDDVSLEPEDVVVCGERVYFAHRTDANGRELWSSNGTALGTALVKDIHPGVAGSSPQKLGCLDDRVMFFTESPAMGLWRSDGTAAGTLPVAAVPPYWPGIPVQFGQGVFFSLEDELWLSDGTPGGTRLVKQLGITIDSPVVVAGYNAYLLDHAGALWRTNGSAAGTTPVAMQGSAVNLFGYGDRVAFQKRNPNGLCSSDGASVSCFDTATPSSYGDFSMLPMNGRLYYPVSDLRSTDGVTSTSTGIQSVGSIMAVAGGRLYYGNWSGPLHETDGTPAGTRRIHRKTHSTVASGGRLFIAEDELYAYDLPATPTSLAPRTVPVTGGQVVIHGRGFVAPVSVYVDKTPVTVVSVTPTAITFTAPPRQNGTYEVKLVTGDGREMTTDQRLAYACTPLTATIGASPLTACPLAPVQLQGGGGSRCAWFPSTGLDNPSSCHPVATLTETTTYTLIVSDAAACSSTNHPTVTVTVTPKPSAQITPAGGPYIPGGTYTASVPDAGPGATYAWSVTGGQLSGATNQRTVAFITGCAHPKLFVVVTGANGCSTSSSYPLFLSANSVTISSVSPRYANAGATIAVTGSGFQCVTGVALYDRLFNSTLRFTPTVLGATSLTFRLPVDAPAKAYVGLTSAIPERYENVGLDRPLRDDLVGLDRTTDLLLRNANTGLTEVLGFGPFGPRAPVARRPAGSSDYTVAAVYEFGWTNPEADILWQRTTTRELVLQLTQRAEEIVLPRVPAANLKLATVGDLDGNGFPELIMRSTASGATEIWTLSSGWETVTVQPLHGGGNLNWSIIGSRDFDGDGKHDILWRDANNGMTLIWFMNGASIRASQIIHQGGNTGWTIAALGDFDRDIQTDILWRQTSTGATILWKMNGASIASSTAVHPGGNLGWTIVAAGDFNGDSKADVLWRENAQGTVLRWIMNGSQITMSEILFQTLDPAIRIESPRM